MAGKVSLKKNARWFLGMSFAAFGGCFTLLGVVMLAVLMSRGVWQAGAVFCVVGSLFLTIGLCLAVAEAKKRRQAEALMAAGRYVWGAVADFVPDRLIQINHRNPYFVVVHYADAWGRKYRFKSSSLRISRMPSMIGQKVRVYVSDDGFSRYYVDMEPVLSKTETY